ncbi:heterokaryon incompatibility protein-domain-containing protein [Halenospora varia]|nr:heterokaryon incompatibility protein-domain-containing protein [Halenospora varia]
MICNVCFCMLRGQTGRQWKESFGYSFDHQANLIGLLQSVDMACCICRRVWEDLPIFDDRQKIFAHKDQPMISAHISRIKKREGTYRLDFTLSRSVTAKYSQFGTLLLQQTIKSESSIYTPQSRKLNSQEIIKLARFWIAKCIGSGHKNCFGGHVLNRHNMKTPQTLEKFCNGSTKVDGIAKLASEAIVVEAPPPYYPTRLLELGSADEPYVRLIITKNAAHRNEPILKPPEGQYVTLSHCWGKTKNPFVLNAGNLDLFLQTGIPLKELPRTFAESIHFARQLGSGIKYIWIDSLCIIQGDKADWLVESVQMYQVYRSSYCNISATAAKDSSYGLYAERNPHHLWQEEVQLNMQRDRDSTNLEAPIQRCNIVDPSLWERKVDAAPVNTRAWVLQERLLAPRVLHFCDDQIAWECNELDASEVATNGIENLELKSGAIRDRVRFKDLVSPNNNLTTTSTSEEEISHRAHENWKRIVERYSQTNLTNPQDKLIALAGIAELLSTQIRVPYVAGMWNNKYFTSQLLWRVEIQYKNGKFSYPSKRPKQYRAPSFSWFAIDAPQGIKCGETQDESALSIKTVDVDIQPQPEPNSEFGFVKEGGFITLECRKLPVSIDRKPRETVDGVQNDMFTWTLGGNRQGEDAKMHPNVYLDSPEDDFEDICDQASSTTWLVLASKNSDGDVIGLLLQQKMDKGEHFCRKGLTVIPGYVARKYAFIDEMFKGDDGGLEDGGAKKEIIKVV